MEYNQLGKLRKEGFQENLEREYMLRKKGLSVVIEELKQRITAKAAKIKRCEERINQFNQNRLFQNNRKRLFEKLENQDNVETAIPDANQSMRFWREINNER